MRHRLPAILLLLVLIFRISFGWADMPGGCHHSMPSQPVAQTGSDAPPCHGQGVPPCHMHEQGSPCHGAHGGTPGDDCGCGCCHIAVAMVSVGMVVPPASHEPAIALAPPADLTYTPTLAHRPPIA